MVLPADSNEQENRTMDVGVKLKQLEHNVGVLQNRLQRSRQLPGVGEALTISEEKNWMK